MLANARRCANIGAIDRDRKRVRWSMKCVESSSYVRLKAQNVRAERENIVRACTLHVENVVLVTHIRYIEGYSDAHLRAPLLYRVKAFVWREEPAHATPDIRPSATTIRERYARAGGCTCISKSARVCPGGILNNWTRVRETTPRHRRCTPHVLLRPSRIDRPEVCSSPKLCGHMRLIRRVQIFAEAHLWTNDRSFRQSARNYIVGVNRHGVCIDFAFRSSVGDKSESIAYIYQGCMWYYLEKGGIDL